MLGIKKTCAAGESFHFIITPIDIKFRPKANFTASPIVVCVNEPVSINNNSCPNTNSPIHYWDFGDGTNSSSQNPGSHTYNSPGTYTITYSLTNSCGTSTHSETITVLPPTIIQPVITLADQCTPAQFVPDVNSQNVLTFLWTSNPTSGISITLPVDSQPNFNVTNAGNYNINLQVTGCCSSINSICQWDTSLTFYQGPNLSLTPIPTYCNSTTISPTSFISISGTISQYNWQFPGGSPSSSNSANPGNIFIQLREFIH
ncbi:MAG: PKD domain-containing protein [Bacteroidetes bacterium]|nr:PKD domain-containing protein [Bacteroidota bacterium]